MSGFGRDLIGAANCGTANPLMQMAGQMQGMGAQLSDVRTFASADKPGLLQQPGHPGQAMRPQQPGAEASAFMQAYQQGAKPMGPAMGMPMHLQQQRQMQHMAQQQRMMPQAPAVAGGQDMVDQFMQMELHNKQKEDFERAFQQSHAPGPDMWSMEFQQQQQMHQQRLMQQNRLLHPQQQHAPPAQWASEFNQMSMMRSRMGPMGGMGMGMGMGMGGMGMGMGPMAMGPMASMAPAMSASASSSSAQVVEEKPAEQATTEASEEDLENIYSDATSNLNLEEAYAQATGGQSWSSEFANQQAASQPQGLGGGMDKDMLQQLMNSDNPKWRNSKFLKFIDKISKGQIEFRDNQAIEKTGADGEAWANEFGAEEFAASQHPASWGDEFADMQNQMPVGDAHLAEEKTQAERWLEEYEATGDADTEFKDFDWQSALTRAKEGLPERRDPTYQFQENNPYLQSADPFADGLRLFQEGKLKEAILAFEATVQQQPEHADAWSLLGEAQAQNEEENNAIAAFLKCVSIDPYNLKALMHLGVSYTNDLEESRALNYLKTWMQNNPDYQGAALSQQKQRVDEYLQFYGGGNAPSQYTYDNTLHNEVTKMFLDALAIHPDDADLHTVLGVLYHISSDFDKAIEAFKNAVKLRPEDAALWNRLGATLANSSRSSEAVHAYKRALELRPAFVRALANLAIAYANQGLHEDAVRTYLTTLAHNPDANHVWSYLRISLSHLQRDDLVELSHKKDANLFRPFFEF